MDPNKWRIKKEYGLWHVYAPGDEYIPFLVADTFGDAVSQLPYCQRYDYMTSQRWRDG